MTTDEKIDDLARMVAQGFTEIRADMSEMREEMATKADLAELREEVADIRTTMATKKDLLDLKFEINHSLDQHIGILRKDLDEHASRIKTLEQTVFPR